MVLSSQSSDDEAPEAFSFNSQKKAAKGAEAAVQKHHTAKKQKRKEENRNRDKALKERAARTKSSAKAEVQEEEPSEDEESEQNELEARMARAMRDAEAESDEEEEGADEAENEDEAMGSADQDDEPMDDNAESEDNEDSDEEEEVHLRKPQKNPDYLPEHLFESAFSQTSATVSSLKRPSTSLKAKAMEPPMKKRKRSRTSSKDIVVGSRTIRTLPSVFSETPAALRPTRGVSKFLKHSLNMSGNSKQAKVRGWERRAANVGVMRTNGPAAHFVRRS